VLPAYPVLAVLVALRLGEATEAGVPQERSWRTRAAAALFVVVPIVAFFVVRHEEPGFESATLGLVLLSAVGLWVLASGAEILRTERNAVVALALGMLATYAIVLAWFTPIIGAFTSDRDLVAELRSAALPPDRVVVHKVRPFSFLFYSGWPIVYKVPEDEYRAALLGPGRVYVLTKPSRLETLMKTDPPLELRKIAGNHRRVVFERVDRLQESGDARLP
jgi:hypothetical protein